jgi:hypothetical protein
MFDDISLSDLDLKYQGSQNDERGNFEERERTFEDSIQPLEFDRPLIKTSE